MDSSADPAISALAAILPCGFMGFYFLFMIALWLVMIAGVILWIVMLVDVVQRKTEDFPNKSENDRMVWILIVALTNWLGGIIYYFAIYRKYPRSKS